MGISVHTAETEMAKNPYYLPSIPFRGTIGPCVQQYILHIHTRPTVAWGPPPGAYRAREGSRTILVFLKNTSQSY